MATSVTPVPAVNSQVNGSSVVVFAPNPNGGLIQNPASNTDQGIGQAEDLFVNPLGPATLAGNGTTFRIPPGGTWNAIPGQTTQTQMNAATAGHEVAAVQW